jgi:riboflavin kinase/FMN adenylyltransferase
MMNIGTRPTFNGHEKTLEVNIFDYQGDLYGRELTVVFSRRIRDERRFDSPELLAEQLLKDKEEALRCANE